MKIFIFTFFYFYVTFNFCPFFELDLSLNFFTIFFTFLFILNYFFFSKLQFNNIKIDLLLNWIRLFLINSKNFFLFFIITIKKTVYFLFFKFFRSIKTNLVFSKEYLSKIFLIWRPLFKKLSYFGFFRTNRNKWLK